MISLPTVIERTVLCQTLSKVNHAREYLLPWRVCGSEFSFTYTALHWDNEKNFNLSAVWKPGQCCKLNKPCFEISVGRKSVFQRAWKHFCYLHFYLIRWKKQQRWMSGMVCMTRFTGPSSYYLSERQQIVLADLQLILHDWLRNLPTLIIDPVCCCQ